MDESPARIGIAGHLWSTSASYRRAGVSRYIAELVGQLARMEVPDVQYTVFVGPHADDLLSERRPDVTFAATRWPVDRPLARIAWEQLAAPVVAARARLDLFHGTVNAIPLVAFEPQVVTIHDLAFLAHPEALSKRRRQYLTAITKLSARRAKKIIAVSEFTGGEVVRRLGVPEDKVAVVPNAVDSAFRPLPSDEVDRFRAETGVTGSVLLCVGTLEPRKNLGVLLGAVAQVAPTTDAELVVVGGQGWMYDDALAQVERLGLTKRVRFTGFVSDEDLCRWYNVADVFVYPSVYEGFGLPVLEAMACGLPTVTGAGTAMADVTGDAALLVDVRSPTQVASAIQRLLDDGDLRVDLRRRGLAAAAQFSWNRTAAETLDVYRDVLGR